MTRIEELEEQISNLELQRAVVFQKMKPLQDEAGRLHHEIEVRRNQIDALKLEQMSDKVDWPWLLTVNPESTVRYKARQKALANIGLHHGMGYYLETNQSVVTVALYHDRTPENDARNAKQLAAVKEILPFLQPHEDGAKWIDILEHTLSAGGTNYLLKAYADGKFTVGNRWREQAFNTLEDAFEHIRKHLYYERERED
jgi:hypothetical protein